MNNERINIKTYDDGIYLVVNRLNEEDYLKIEEIQELLKKENVRNIDFDAIFSAVTNPEINFQVKISDNLNVMDLIEFVEIKISQDKLKAYLKFQQAFFDKFILTKQDLYTILENFGVLHGIIDNALEDIIISTFPDHEYLVAKGSKVKSGTDGQLKLYFDTEEKTLKPKLLDNGMADYLNIDFYQQAKKGDILIRRIPSVPGVEGKNVFGEEIPTKTVKKAPPFPQGKNIHILEEENILVAGINGQIKYTKNRIDINPFLELQEVSTSTGNINFDGTVVVFGNVIYGTRIDAGGSVKVQGIVEGATIISGGDVIMSKGAMGGKKALIVAEGDVKANFIDSCTVKAGKSVYSNSIMHSSVYSEDKIVLTGKKGLLVGGDIHVKNEVSAKNIGSSLGTITNIEIGNSSETIEKHNKLLEEKKVLSDKASKLEQIINTLKSVGDNLTPEKKHFMNKTISTKSHVDKTLSEKNNEIKRLKKEIKFDNGRLVAHDTIHSGVKVSIGDATMSIEDTLSHVCLINRESKVCQRPL